MGETMAQNNNIIRSEKWCLEMVANDESDSEGSVCETFFLNIGKTTIGRNIKADLTIDSEFSSRNHCSIELTDSDELYLTDSVSNLYMCKCVCILYMFVCLSSLRCTGSSAFSADWNVYFFFSFSILRASSYLFIVFAFCSRLFCCSRVTAHTSMKTISSNKELG